MGRLIDLTDQVFGRLTVLNRAENTKAHKARWTCRCSCGNVTTVIGVQLIHGHTASCGCLHNEQFAAWAKQSNHDTTHGLGNHPLYGTWSGMMRRCYNLKATGFHNYGGRGISVCDRWHSVACFVADIESAIGVRPKGRTLDRYPNNDGNYEPGNVRWATREEQEANKRRYGAELPLPKAA